MAQAAAKFAAVLFTVAFCAPGVARAQSYPEFSELRLKLGRSVWIETCKPCHTTDIAGAPQVSDKAAWAPRLKQSRETLYEHALKGLFGPKGTEMPPRGGNAVLTDDQVKAAVDYMITIVSH